MENFMKSNSFSTWTMKHLVIDNEGDVSDGNVIVSVPDKCGTWFRVTCEETKTNITPVSCSCGHDHCKHQDVVTAFYNRIYKSTIEKEAAKKVATPVVVEQFDGSRTLTSEEWEEIIRKDKIRQRREKDADWSKILEARAQGKRKYTSALAS